MGAPALLHPSRVLRRLRAGEICGCIKINLADPRVVEIAAMCGFDCVWLDYEHVPNTLETIENQVRAAKAYGTDALVRVSKGSYSELIRPLEMDAAGIMIPHLMSADEAREVVRQTRFSPVGRRPLDGGNADGGYCMVDLPAYTAHANRERMVIVQIEDPEPLEELEEIAAMEGIDMLFFGPGDFAHALGVPGDLGDPRVEDARRRVADAARRHGKFAGTVGSVQMVPSLVEMGYRFLSVGADVVALWSAFRPIVAALDGGAHTGTGKSTYQPE